MTSPPKKKVATKCTLTTEQPTSTLLTTEQPTSTLLTTQKHLHTTEQPTSSLRTTEQPISTLLTREHPTRTLLATQKHLHTMQIHKDDRDKQSTSNIKVSEPIQEMSKPSSGKTSRHNSSVYYGNHLLIFHVFCLILFLNFRLSQFFQKFSQSYQSKAIISFYYFQYF